MNERNNLGRQYTSDPNFGKVYPNTQYKGYSEHEATPFGNPSTPANNLEIHSNQYGYVGHSQSRSPYQPETHTNVRSHGNQFGTPYGQTRSQNMSQSQYQGMGQTANQGGQTAYQSPANFQSGRQTYGNQGSQYQGNLHQSGQSQVGHNQGSSYQGGLSQGGQYQGSSYQSGLSQGGHYQATSYQGHLSQGNQYQSSGTQYPGTQYPTAQPQQANYQYGSGDMSNMGNMRNQEGTTMQSQSSQQSQGTMHSTQAGQQQQKGPQYNDRDRVNDLLASEKYLTEGYNISTFEATNPQLHDTLKNILNETHENRETLYREMENRGWYKTEPADQQQISQAHNQFSGYRSQLPF